MNPTKNSTAPQDTRETTVIEGKDMFLEAESLFFEVLGFELRAYTLSHSTSPFL
jgi:hypothetical protein